MSALETCTICGIVRSFLSSTYSRSLRGKVPYLRGCPSEPSEPVITNGCTMNFSRSASFMLNEATLASATRTMPASSVSGCPSARCDVIVCSTSDTTTVSSGSS